MKIMFSGIQPTGIPHIGNYFGAFENWLRLSRQGDSKGIRYKGIFSIVDLHALSVPYEPKDMRQFKLELAISFLSMGLDPNQEILFFQSDVPEHTELSWIFNNLAPIGMLERMTQFKDKSEQFSEAINAGLFCYPVLQAADVLLYKAHGVPVGKDQEQHLELTREIARKFNNRFGATFPEPVTLLGATPKILGLDGVAKMSKSKGNDISLTATPEEIQNRLKGAFTDPQRLRLKDPGRPEVCNIFALHHLVTSKERIDAIASGCRAATWGCGQCKKELGENLAIRFEDFREKFAYWTSKPKDVEAVFRDGAKKARAIASETMNDVRSKMGLR